MFQFLQPQRAILTTFTGRTEVHGKDRVPAVSFRLKFSGPNTLLDLLSPTLRPAVYMAAEGQEQLPGLEPSTPLLRSKDVKHLALESISYEGWQVHIEHGIDDQSALRMGAAKVDSFAVDFHDGGTVEIECRVSTCDIDAEGAGLLWSKQTREVPVCFIAPKALETNPAAGAIDGSTEAFERDHPPMDEDERQATILDAMQGPEDDAESEGGEPDAQPEPTRSGPAWPFPEGDPRALANGTPAAAPKVQLSEEAAWPFPGSEAERERRAAAVKAKGDYEVELEQRKKGRAAGIKYRDPANGQTWSGRGLKPKWLTSQLEQGKTLADFDVAQQGAAA